MSQDKDTLLGHASDNDGIQEYDNALPDWWLGLFLFTIVWSVGYVADYHWFSARSQTASYDAEMAAATERWPQPEGAPLVYDAAVLAEGAQIFAANCVGCHGADLNGAIGPSLVDATWIHGSDPEQIRATITAGVPAKGMITWGPILGPAKVAKVAAYVVTRAKAGPPTAPASAPAPVASAEAALPAASGETIYRQNCVVCHGEALEGKVGPSLVDDTWIHGGKLEDIERVITNGVPEKGMVTWGPILGPEKVHEVATFVHGKGSHLE